MSSSPRVTVAILAYYENYLAECIESVLGQTYRDMKVIVYDDCSPNDLKGIVDRYDDPRLEYKRNEENLGELENTNHAISLCDTEYINTFHGDDVMFPWMIEKLVAALDANPTAGLAFSTRYYSGSLEFEKFINTATPVLYRKGELGMAIADRGSPAFVVSPSATYRKALIDRDGFKITRNGSLDLYTWFYADSMEFDLCGIDTPLVYHRGHDEAQSSVFSADRWAEGFRPLYRFALEQCLDEKVLSFIRRSAARTSLSVAARNRNISNYIALVKLMKHDFDYSVPISLLLRTLIVGGLGGLISTKLRAKIASFLGNRK